MYDIVRRVTVPALGAQMFTQRVHVLNLYNQRPAVVYPSSSRLRFQGNIVKASRMRGAVSVRRFLVTHLFIIVITTETSPRPTQSGSHLSYRLTYCHVLPLNMMFEVQFLWKCCTLCASATRVP
jgi:hypothetical protein